jgi:hypothetical protein
MATDTLNLRAREAYERSRLRFSLSLVPAALVLPVTSALLGTPLPSAVVLGAGLVLLLLAATWRGGALARGALNGVEVGLVPLALAHSAKLYGHVCTPAGCSTLCVPACASGGVVAGLALEWLARRSAQPNVVRGVGLVSALLTGALGCSCVGASGILALVVALGLSSTTGRVLARFANRGA